VSVRDPRMAGYLKRHTNTPLNHPSERTVRSDSCLFSNRNREFRIWETVTLPTRENNNLGKTHTNIHAPSWISTHDRNVCAVQNGLRPLCLAIAYIRCLVLYQKTTFQLQISLRTVRGPWDDPPATRGGGQEVEEEVGWVCLARQIVLLQQYWRLG